MVNMYLFLIFLSFYNNGFYEDYSILSQGIEKGEVEIKEKHYKKKKPYITLLTNVALPFGITFLSPLFLLDYDSTEAEDYLGMAGVISLPVFTFTTIPAHIYVKNDAGKVFLLILGKVWGIGIMITAYFQAFGACVDGEEKECERAERVAFVMIPIGALITGGIYIYEVIDTYRLAVKYNEKIEKEREDSRSSFFIQPFITKRGDIFLTAEIKF